MKHTRSTASRCLMGDMNSQGEEAKGGNGEDISHSSATTSSSTLKSPQHGHKVKFEKHIRKRCTFLNIRLKVVHSKGSTVVPTREAVVTLFKILLDADKTVMLAMYKGEAEQGVEEAIEKTIDLQQQWEG